MEWPNLPRHDMAPYWETEVVGMAPHPLASTDQMLLTLSVILAEQAAAIKKGT